MNCKNERRNPSGHPVFARMSVRSDISYQPKRVRNIAQSAGALKPALGRANLKANSSRTTRIKASGLQRPRGGKTVARKRDGLYRRGNILAFRYKDTDGIWREKQTGK